MENKEVVYRKPPYKILARFGSECLRYVMKGKNILPVLVEFPAYYRYNRRMVMPLEAELPWICHGALQKLREIVRPEMKVLEFGSGGSTLFLAEKVKSLTSIEHDLPWYRLVSIKIVDGNNKNVVYIPPDKLCQEEEFKSYHGMEYAGRCFKGYVGAIENFPDESLDLVIIDGRARPACLKYVRSKVKQGGYILFDNSDRASYQVAIAEFLKNWKRMDFNGVTVYDAFFNSTSLFEKPNAS